jgi:tetratricopeptide (TPR) repeat protein
MTNPSLALRVLLGHLLTKLRIASWKRARCGLGRRTAEASGRFLRCAIIAVSLASAVHAADAVRQQQVEILNQALRTFDQAVELRPRQPEESRKIFADAAARFQTLVDGGVRNGRLYYDLGNAYLQAGRLGEAIVNYRRAERLIPGDSRLQENLRFARSLCQTQIPVSGQRAFIHTLFFWHHDTPLRSRMIAALLTYAIFWFALIGWIYRKRAAWWYVLAPALVVWVAAGTSAFIELYHPPAPAGVVVADNVAVQKGNGEGFELQFQEKLHPGVEFTLLERRGDWLNIELGDGKSGWVRAIDAELI